MTIPIMFCFNNNYVIPAAACFISIMEHANPKKKYHFYILHSNITEENQEKLKLDVKKYKNCSLEFKYMNNQFADIFQKIPNHSHFSKELLYKLNCPTVFKDLDKIIISDVDVIFLDDIAKIYDELDVDSDYYYGGIPRIEKKDENIYQGDLYKKFSKTEIKKLEQGIGAGYLILNLKAMRKNKIESKMFNYLNQNFNKLIQIEQDIINIVCYKHIKILPFNYMVCSYEYDYFNTEKSYKKLVNNDELKVKNALENPIQLHFATTIKPWKYVDCTKSEIWFSYFAKSVFLKEYLNALPKKIRTKDNILTRLMKTKLYSFLLNIYHLLKKILNFFTKKREKNEK